MLTKKDLLQAHRLMTQRASQGLILGEPDSPEQPLRRLNVAVFSGVMLAVLVAAGFGVVGLLRSGGATGLQQTGMILIEKETGTRYVWCDSNMTTLCPVINYSSAKLLAGSGGSAQQKLVSRDSLSKFQRGALIGIPGAPDSLPGSGKLVRMPWSVCVRSADTGLAGRTSFVSLLAGSDAGGTALRDDQAILVQAEGQPWLLWRNNRMRVQANEVSGLSPTASPVQISAKWLNALPEGAPFRAPEVPGRGTPTASGPQGSGTVGQLYTSPTVDGKAWYVLMPDGLARISEIEGQLMKLDPAAAQSSNPVSISPAVLNSAPKHKGTITSAALQAKMPTFVPYADTSALCAIYRDQSGNNGPAVTVGGTLPTPPQNASGGADSVDQLVFPPGRAALAGVLPSQGRLSAVSTYYLVAEGRRFPLSSPDVAAKLGYTIGTDAIPIPANVLGLIPTGPALDPAAAKNPVNLSGG